MNKKIILLLISVCFFSYPDTFAGLKKANRHFEFFRYTKAIPLYKKATKSSKEEIRKEATIRLGDCYRLINNVSEARSWYAVATDNFKTDPVNFYYLGKAQQSLGKYDEAEKSFLRYAELKPDDKRGKILAKVCHDIGSLDNIPVSVELKNATELNSRFFDFGAAFFGDGIIFASDRKAGPYEEPAYEWTNNNYLDLFYSKPHYYQDFWSDMTNPEKMSREFNQNYHDGPACFIPGENRIYVTRTLQSKVKKDKDNIRTNLLQIFSADISDRNRVKYQPFPFNSEEYSVGHPTLSDDGKKIIFSSDMPGGFGGSDLYLAELKEGKWSAPVNLGENVNTFGNEVFPFLYNDSTLCFSSDGHLGFGGLDVYETALTDSKWGVAENMLKPLNSSYDDFGLVFRKGAKDGFLSSNRPGGAGADDIYAIRNYSRGKATEKQPEPAPEEKPVIVPPLVKPLLACGYVKEKKNFTPLPDATVFLFNSATNEVLVLKSDANGYYEAPVEKDVLYVAKAMKNGYFDDCTSFRFSDPSQEQCNKIPRDLLLDKYGLNQVFRIDNIYYDLDKWFIRPDARPPLDNLVRIMNTYPINIELSSHTDSRATFEYNERLSQRRAEAAVAYLVQNGIAASRMTAKGYGERMLVNGCSDGVKCTEAEHQLNRRTEFKITSTDSRDFGNKVFDASVFHAGDKIPLLMLGSDFFKECFLTGQTGEKAETKAEAQAQAEAKAEEAEKSKQQQEAVSRQAEAQAQAEAKAKAEAKEAEKSKQQQEAWFAVQIKAANKPITLSSSDFAGEKDVYEKKTGPWFKYYAGKYSSFADASNARTALNAKFPGCFIVAFENGEIVPVNDLRKKLVK